MINNFVEYIEKDLHNVKTTLPILSESISTFKNGKWVNLIQTFIQNS